MGDLISIIIPIYNAEKYLEKCITSILGQSYSDFELLLIDDGSRDGSAVICNYFRKRDSRIKYFYQQNKGVSAARNNGLEKASGKYLTFVDADDWIEETYLEKLFTGIEKKELALCGYKQIEEDREFYIYEAKLKAIKNILPFFAKENLVFGEKNSIVDLSSVKGYVWRCLFLKETIDDNKIHFDENVFLSEDLIFLLTYINSICIKEIAYVEEYLYNYVRHAESACRKKYKNGLSENRKAANGLIEKEIQKAEHINNSTKISLINRLRADAFYEILSNEKNAGSYKVFYLNCKKYLNDNIFKITAKKYVKIFYKQKEYKKVFILMLFKVRLYCAVYLLFKINQKVKGDII